MDHSDSHGDIGDVFDVDLNAAPDDVDTAKAPEFDQASHAHPEHGFNQGLLLLKATCCVVDMDVLSTFNAIGASADAENDLRQNLETIICSISI